MFVWLTTKNRVPLKNCVSLDMKKALRVFVRAKSKVKVEVAVDGLAVEDVILSTCVLGRDGETVTPPKLIQESFFPQST